jgi:hypothetical protein
VVQGFKRLFTIIVKPPVIIVGDGSDFFDEISTKLDSVGVFEHESSRSAGGYRAFAVATLS